MKEVEESVKKVSFLLQEGAKGGKASSQEINAAEICIHGLNG